MIVGTQARPGRYEASSFDLFKVIFGMVIVAVLPGAALFGGMKAVVLALGGVLAAIVWADPKEAPQAGMLYLFAVGIVLPYGSRFDFEASSTEMQYWSVGLLLITSAAVARIGISRVFAVPFAAKMFLGIASASAVYAITHGAAISYVLRQFYGVLLLILYIGIGLQVGDEDLIVRRSASFGVFCAVCFFIYYAAVFPEYGFHKEMGFSGTQASLLAITVFIAGCEARNARWLIAALVLMLVPILVFMRRDVLTFLVALPIAMLVKSKSKMMRIVCLTIVCSITVTALFPPVTEKVSETIKALPMVGSIIPAGADDATTLYERSLQLGAALVAVKVHPWLGDGLGSAFKWESPTLGTLEVGFVDNGWGYLLQKMGLLGVGAFLWVLVLVIGHTCEKSVALSTCIIAAVVVTMYSEPVFLHFTTAPFVGTFAGLVLAPKKNEQPK